MKFYPVTQREDEWHKLRLGMPTASQFDRIITPVGKPSSQASLYEAELVAERIFQRPMGKDIGGIPAVRHGRETEDEAAQWLERELGKTLEPGGFAIDDTGRYGCSPDRLIVSGNWSELVEIKCPYVIPQHVKNLLFGMEDHKAQIQGQLLVTGCRLAHCYSYHRDCPPYYARVERDESFIAALRKVLDKFCTDLDIDHQRALRMGNWRT